MNAATVTVVRFALVTVTETNVAPLYVHDLQPYTMPSSTDEVTKAKTWASARGAMAAATRRGLTNVIPVEVVCDVNRPKIVLGLAADLHAREQQAERIEAAVAERETECDAECGEDIQNTGGCRHYCPVGKGCTRGCEVHDDEGDAGLATREMPVAIPGTVLAHDGTVVMTADDWALIQDAMRTALSASVLDANTTARLQALDVVDVEIRNAA